MNHETGTCDKFLYGFKGAPGGAPPPTAAAGREAAVREEKKPPQVKTTEPGKIMGPRRGTITDGENGQQKDTGIQRELQGVPAFAGGMCERSTDSGYRG